ncbi:MAG: hypothetical protein SH857_08395 [Chitinophagales bacterium]|nr:hypothetical protein [Chitinophagales bacterium]
MPEAEIIFTRVTPLCGASCERSSIFYDKTWIRKPLFDRYGQRLCEALTDVFMGERDYPHDAMKRAGKYLKELVVAG